MEAKPTYYKNILFRSKLEASYAKTLDSLNIKWAYEVNGYRIKNIDYLPDFWLSEINTFLEAKGPITPGAEKAEELAQAVEDDWFNSTTIVMIGNELGELKMADGNDQVVLAKCRKCKKYWLMPTVRSFNCRNCNEYDGDHHIEEYHNKLNLEQIKIEFNKK